MTKNITLPLQKFPRPGLEEIREEGKMFAVLNIPKNNDLPLY